MHDKPESGTVIYECTLDITGLTDFGVGLDLALDGGSSPPEGIRIDVSVAGTSNGPVLKGQVSAIDYLYVRPDGRITIHVHGVITTDDGARLSLFADGVLSRRLNTPILDLRENVTLFTSAPKYTWVNGMQVWGEGTVDLANQKLFIKARVA